MGSTGWARCHTSSKKNSLKFPSGLQEFVLKVGEVCPPAAREAARRHSPNKTGPQPCLNVRQSSIMALFPGGKQHPQQCPLHMNTALPGSDFTQEYTHTERPKRIDRVSSPSDSYPLPHTSYKTLKETRKSFFAPASTLAPQE